MSKANCSRKVCNGNCCVWKKPEKRGLLTDALVKTRFKHTQKQVKC